MEANKGIGPGFDIWRVLLSLLVILLHSVHVSYGSVSSLTAGPSGPLWASILPIFFGLSGFLVAGSAIRVRSLKTFLIFRGLRIIPALAVEVTLCALILGPLLTTLPLADYFADPKFRTYFGNIVGWVHFTLPGVFADNPRRYIVNQNLWTLHAELFSYLVMGGMIITGIAYSRLLTTILFALVTFGVTILHSVLGYWPLAALRGVVHPQLMVYAFLFGVFAYHWRDHIVINNRLFAAALIIGYILLLFPGTLIAAAFCQMYVMIYVGMQKIPRIEFLQKGDYSYGLYLYAFPIQQTVVMLFPATREWYWNFSISLVLAFLFAALSWHTIEKPALALKRHFLPARKPVPATSTLV